MSSHTQYVSVPFSPEQIARLRLIAHTRGEAVSALIRQVVEDAYLREGSAERLAAVERLAALNLPVAEWEQLERESVGWCSVE